MLTIYHGSGSGSFRLGSLKQAGLEWAALRDTLLKLLATRGNRDAASFLSKYPFSLYVGENDFGDKFSVLYSDVSLDQYVDVDGYRRTLEGRNALQSIARTMTELGEYVRFIAIGIKTTDAPSPVSQPVLENPTATVERALIDAEQLLTAVGPVSAADRAHTALHGYLYDLGLRLNLIEADEDRPDITRLFKLLRGSNIFVGSTHSPHAEKVAQGLAVAMDALNPIRNKGTLAHPTADLVTEAEAMLTINAARSILHYLDAVVAR